jgi:hypothetical protein
VTTSNFLVTIHTDACLSVVAVSAPIWTVLMKNMKAVLEQSAGYIFVSLV